MENSIMNKKLHESNQMEYDALYKYLTQPEQVYKDILNDFLDYPGDTLAFVVANDIVNVGVHRVIYSS